MTKNCKGIIPADIELSLTDKKILDSFSDNIEKIRKFIDNQQLNEYVKFIIDRSFDANKYFNDEAPWNKKNDAKRLNSIVYASLEIIRKISILLKPIIPNVSSKALLSLNLKEEDLNIDSILNHFSNKPGTKLKNQGILFKKVEKK